VAMDSFCGCQTSTGWKKNMKLNIKQLEKTLNEKNARPNAQDDKSKIVKTMVQ
jgi:hypothetical protein